MDKVAKQVWCQALRSGEFKQGRGVLKHQRGGEGTKYCCLGVAREVFPFLKGETLGGPRAVEFTDASLKLLGLTPEQQVELIRLNDAEKQDFPTIAKYIERNL